MTSKFVLCLVPLVSGGLLAFANAARGDPSADLAQPKPSAHALEFDSIHMIDRQTGWAQNARAVFLTNDWLFNDKAIWRTTDGGQSWHRVLCASPAETGNVSAFFRDSTTAWVAVADESTNVTIFRTGDGGASWSWSKLSERQAIADCWLAFTGADQGWLMLIADHGMNSSPGDLYRTDDGGAHWRRVNSTQASPHGWIWEDADLPEFDKPHPYLICGGTIAFRNDSAGWIRGSLASTAPVFLFATQDGGQNWQVQHLALPASLESGHMEPAGLPRFFHPDSREGILPAEYHPTNSEAASFATVVYSTHDGGLTWHPTTPVRFSGAWNFINASKGWLWSPEPHGTGSTAPVKGILFRTDDGGISWKAVGTGKGLERYLTRGEDIVQLDFVDGEYGWAIARNRHNLTQLLHTTDGGETWRAIQRTERR
jgi:photosystem II stability/assembly factor-like uncharacterized protein